MTIDTFLRRLRQTPRMWRVLNGLIRLDRCVPMRCPIAAVSDIEMSTRIPETLLFAEDLGLTHADAVNVMLAADNSFSGNETDLLRLRRRLLRACGLKAS